MIYEYEGKNEKEAIEKAAQELGLEKDQFTLSLTERYQMPLPAHRILTLWQIQCPRMNLNRSSLTL